MFGSTNPTAVCVEIPVVILKLLLKAYWPGADILRHWVEHFKIFLTFIKTFILKILTWESTF